MEDSSLKSKIISVTLANRSRSTISNPRPVTCLHKYGNYGSHQAMHKKYSVTLTNRPRSTTSNPKQGTMGLHKYVKYQSHIPYGSPVVIYKPSVLDVMDETYVMGGTLFPSVTAKCPPGGGIISSTAL